MSKGISGRARLYKQWRQPGWPLYIDALDRAIDAYEAAVKDDPKDARAEFRLETAFGDRDLAHHSPRLRREMVGRAGFEPATLCV